MLSAIVVDKPNVATGDMSASALDGFIRTARQLGYTVTDERAFLKNQQEACFRWGEQY